MDKHYELLSSAMIMVDCATREYLDGNDMAFFCMINGIGQYGLESFPGAGHNYYVILEAIYKYYNANPDKKVDSMLFNTLMKCINAGPSTKALSLICDYIVAQVKNENQRISRFGRQRVSPFKLDNIQLLKQMRFAVLNDADLSNNELAIALLNDTIRICEETMGEKVV